MPRVLVWGVVLGTLECHSMALWRTQGMAPRHSTPVGPGEPSQAKHGEAGSRRSPKAWACAELGAFSAAQAARTQHPCPRSGAREACWGTSQRRMPGALVQPSKTCWHSQ